MKIDLLPIYFEPGRDTGFDRQLDALRGLFAAEANFLSPVALGQPLPKADAVIFPQLLGEAYRRVVDFNVIDRPILIVTSEFGTVSMWDWELISYLKEQNVATLAPYTVVQARKVLAAIRVRRQLKETKFVVY